MEDDGVGGVQTTDDPDFFFQSDRDLEARRKREARGQSVDYSKGRALRFKAKILALALQQEALLVATAGGSVARVDLQTRATVATYAGEHKGPVTTVAASGARQFVTGSWDKTAVLWDVETRRPVRRFMGHSDFVKRVLVPTASGLVVTAGSDATLRVCDVRDARTVAVLKGHIRGVTALAELATAAPNAGPHQLGLVSGASEGQIKAWDVRGTAYEARPLGAHLTTVYDLAVADGGATVWSASADKTVQQRSAETGAVTTTLDHPDWVEALALLPDGLLATACNDQLVRVWDPESGNVVQSFQGHFDNITDLVVWGSTIISSSIDATVRFWPVGKAAADEIAQTRAAPSAAAQLSAEEEAELAALMAD